MAKVKKKLTPAQKRAKKAAKAERQRKYQWVFMNGKQVRIKRPPTVDGMPVDQFIEENADPILFLVLSRLPNQVQQKTRTEYHFDFSRRCSVEQC
jgi:hypothetical protein